MASFPEILAFRGRILLYTPSAVIAGPFEEAARVRHAELVVTRGVPDKFIPVSRWQHVCGGREFGLFSTDQRSYTTGVRLGCTDIVWVTNAVMFDDQNWRHLQQAMARGDPENPPRRWLVRPDGSGLDFPDEPPGDEL